MVEFIGETKKLLATLKFMLPIAKIRKDLQLELTVLDGSVAFSVAGSKFKFICKTNGTAKASLLFDRFHHVVKTCKSKEIAFSVDEGYLTTGGLKFSADTWFFEDDTILRTINLPINYTDSDLLKLTQLSYTKEELGFNKMDEKIKAAQARLADNIHKAHQSLKTYGIGYSDVVFLVDQKLQINLNTEKRSSSEPNAEAEQNGPVTGLMDDGTLFEQQ